MAKSPIILAEIVCSEIPFLREAFWPAGNCQFKTAADLDRVLKWADKRSLEGAESGRYCCDCCCSDMQSRILFRWANGHQETVYHQMRTVIKQFCGLSPLQVLRLSLEFRAGLNDIYNAGESKYRKYIETYFSPESIRAAASILQACEF